MSGGAGFVSCARENVWNAMMAPALVWVWAFVCVSESKVCSPLSTPREVCVCVVGGKNPQPVSILGWGRGQKMDAFQLPDKWLAPAAAKADAKCRICIALQHRRGGVGQLADWLLRVRFSTLWQDPETLLMSASCVLRVFLFFFLIVHFVPSGKEQRIIPALKDFASN